MNCRFYVFVIVLMMLLPIFWALMCIKNGALMTTAMVIFIVILVLAMCMADDYHIFDDCFGDDDDANDDADDDDADNDSDENNGDDSGDNVAEDGRNGEAKETRVFMETAL